MQCVLDGGAYAMSMAMDEEIKRWTARRQAGVAL
jgi:hypothetical protein